MRKLASIFVLGLLAALGCGGDDNPSGPNDSGNTVTVGTSSGGLVFTPSNISVAPGANVTWNWNSGGVVHNVTFPDGSNSGNKSSGSFQKNFPTAGTFGYICSIHGAAMSGTVTVSASSSGQNGGTGGGGGGAYP
jgi:plastocyanin